MKILKSIIAFNNKLVKILNLKSIVFNIKKYISFICVVALHFPSKKLTKHWVKFFEYLQQAIPVIKSISKQVTTTQAC